MAVKRLTGEPVPSGVLRRHPAAASISPGGHTETNANGCDVLDSLAEAKGLDLSLYALTLGYDHDKRQIFLYPDEPEALGAIHLNRPAGRIYTFSLTAVFDDDDQLRIHEERTCPLVFGKDTDGEPCIILPMNSSAAKHKSSRRKKGAA